MPAPDAEILADGGRGSGHGLRRRMDPEPGQHRVRQRRDRSQGGQPHPEVDVHGQVEPSIQAARAPVAGCPKERRGLGQVVRVSQQLLQIARGWRRNRPSDGSGGTDQQRAAADQDRIWTRLELRRDSPQGTRLEEVIGIQPAEYVAGGPVESFDQGVRLALVRLEPERHVLARVVAQPLTRSISGATVQDDVLDLDVGGLPRDRLHGLRQPRHGIADWRDYREPQHDRDCIRRPPLFGLLPASELCRARSDRALGQGL